MNKWKSGVNGKEVGWLLGHSRSNHKVQKVKRKEINYNTCFFLEKYSEKFLKAPFETSNKIPSGTYNVKIAYFYQ